MGAGSRSAARAVLVIAVIACVLGLGHVHNSGAPAADVTPMSAAVHRAMSQMPTGAPAAGDPAGHTHHDEHSSCCLAVPGDAGHVMPAPLAPGVTAAPLPVAGDGGSPTTVTPPEPRPPDLRTLCVLRT